MMRIANLALGAAAIMAASACTEMLQAAWTPPTTDVRQAEPGTYAVEPSHTQILFSVMHMGFTHYFGEFSEASGTLTFNPDRAADMAVTVSVPVASLSTSVAKLTAELLAPDWLDAGKFPTLRFTSRRISQTGAETADIAGLLTLHGVTKEVVWHARFIGSGRNILTQKQTIGFELTGQIQRSDFGVNQYVPLVSDAVNVTIEAAFEKQP